MKKNSKKRLCKDTLTILVILLGYGSGQGAPLSVAQRIAVCEQAGDYVQALHIAREALQQSPDARTAQDLSTTVSRLEQRYLEIGYTSLFFDQAGKPKEKLSQLLQLLGVQHPEQQSIKAIHVWAQHNLLRKGERWDTQDTTYEALREKIVPLLTDLGFITERSANFLQYTGAIVHGALLARVRMRIYKLVQQWSQGVRFTHLYFLSGARPLDAHYENEQALLDVGDCPLPIRKGWQLFQDKLPKTECDMIQLVWDQLDIPLAMRNQVQVQFINAPMQGNKRPTTNDTVYAWLQTQPPVGNYIAVSNAPFINRQDIVLRKIARQKENWGFDTIGAAIASHVPLALVLDELARVIYTLYVTP